MPLVIPRRRGPVPYAGQTRPARACSRKVLLTAMASLACATPASAQRLPEARFAAQAGSAAALPAARSSAVDSLPLTSTRLAMGGLAIGILSMAGGAIAGAIISCPNHHSKEEFCGMDGAFVGAAAGELVGIPLGVHLADRRHGSFGWDLVASTAAVFALAPAVSASRLPPLILLVPAGQIAAAVVAERRTAREKARKD